MALEIDIFERTLCCHPIQVVQSPPRVPTPPPEEITPEQEEEEAEPETEPIDKEALMLELECMKRRIQVLQLHLKAKIDECPEEECVDYEVLLNCSKNKEICALQKDHHKLQCQVNELVKCCCVAKDHIQDLRYRMCHRIKEICKLQKQVDILNHWRNTLDHEFGKCIERFEYLKHVKAEWHDVTEKMEQQQKEFAAMEKSFVHKVCFVEEKKSFISAVVELKDMLKELFEYQLQRFDSIEKRIDNIKNVPPPNPLHSSPKNRNPQQPSAHQIGVKKTTTSN